MAARPGNCPCCATEISRADISALRPFALSLVRKATSHFPSSIPCSHGGCCSNVRALSLPGRWPSPDPAGVNSAFPRNPQAWNRYAYVLNNPLILFDRSGLDCVYFDDAGVEVEEVDHDSDAWECSQNGGFWADGWVPDNGSTVHPDPNNDNVLVGSFQVNLDGSIQLGWTLAGAFTPGGFTWSGLTQWGPPFSLQAVSYDQARLQMLGQLGQSLSMFNDPKFYACYAVASGGVGAAGAFVSTTITAAGGVWEASPALYRAFKRYGGYAYAAARMVAKECATGTAP